MATPSKGWKEPIGADEAERHAGYVRVFEQRVRLLPASDEVKPGASANWVGDFLARLDGEPRQFGLQIQFFVDEKRTPIEDASVDWPEDVAPFATVGVLTIPPQEVQTTAGRELAATIEGAAFDPWSALMAHRPLGEVMRERKVVYYPSQTGRR